MRAGFHHKHVIAGVLVALILPGLPACQSVGTTSVILYNDQGNYGKAIEIAREVIAEEPTDSEAHFQLGLALSHMDSVGEAYKHLRRSVELDLNNPRRLEVVENNIAHNFSKHFTNGQVAFRAGNYARAAGLFETATTADPRRGLGHYNLAVTYSRLAEAASGFRDDAAREYTRAIKFSTPEEEYHANALAALSRNLAGGEDWTGAIKWGERFVAIDATNPDMWRHLSNCYQHQGNEARARECLARARR